jgi:hypothetical protein
MKNPGVKYGLLGGAVVAFYFAILYFVKKELFLNAGLQWASMAIYLLFMWQAAKDDYAAKGLGRDFRELTRTPFTVFLLINLVYWLFYYTLHLADPELLRMEHALQLDFLKQQLAAGPGDPQEANRLREQIQTLEKTTPQIGVGDVFLQMGIGAIGGFILSAGIAAIARSRQ